MLNSPASTHTVKHILSHSISSVIVRPPSLTSNSEGCCSLEDHGCSTLHYNLSTLNSYDISGSLLFQTFLSLLLIYNCDPSVISRDSPHSNKTSRDSHRQNTFPILNPELINHHQQGTHHQAPHSCPLCAYHWRRICCPSGGRLWQVLRLLHVPNVHRQGRLSRGDL